MFRPYVLEVITHDESFADDVHKVLCDSPEHANVFMWTTKNDSGTTTYTLHGKVITFGQEYNLNSTLARNVAEIMSVTRKAPTI